MRALKPFALAFTMALAAPALADIAPEDAGPIADAGDGDGDTTESGCSDSGVRPGRLATIGGSFALALFAGLLLRRKD